MERVKKTVRTLVLAVLICAMLTTVAFAAEPGSVWMKATNTSDGKGVEALIVTDTTVTDGVVELTYDSSKLTYEGVVVNEAYVAMFAVNPDEEGVVKISWVAPGAYETDGSAIGLIQVNFTGKSADGLTLTGTVHDAQGDTVPLVGAPDTSTLEEAVKKAEELEPTDFTQKSYAAVEDALEGAKDVLADPCATQAEIDAAAKALNDAMAALCPAPDTSELEKAIKKAEKLDVSKYTEDSYAAVQDALEKGKAVLANPDATQDEIDAAAKALNDAMAALVRAPGSGPSMGDTVAIGLVIALLVLSAAGLVLLFIIVKRRGRK